jgi:MFS family permease
MHIFSDSAILFIVDPKTIQRTYLTLLFGNTLAASLIWGINTIFLLDAGLSNLEAFAANAFFTAGMVLFEVPTGVIADSYGRRISYILGTVTLALTTLMYVGLWYIDGPFWAWALVSLLIGLGFTFFSGALEAWLVDALQASDYKGDLESVFGKGQIITGIAMLSGSVAGGIIAQLTSLGVPFVIRSAILAIMFVVSFKLMHDIGFTPVRGRHPIKYMGHIVRSSIDYGLRVRPVRWIMLASPFVSGAGIYAFYALQPYLLQLYGDERAYTVAGLVAAAVAGAQITGGILAPRIRKLVHHRTSALMLGIVASSAILVAVGLVNNFWIVLLLVVCWGLIFAASTPIRQAYLNGLIPSKQRATVLSFDSLMGSSGAVVSQPVLGRAADVWNYGTSFVIAGAINILATPFVALARREHAPADTDTTSAKT